MTACPRRALLACAPRFGLRHRYLRQHGIAAADIDGDGWDEIYVCQPGGFPTGYTSATERAGFGTSRTGAGLDILDDTACALFVDLRNSGDQDLVLVRPAGRCSSSMTARAASRIIPDAFRFPRAAGHVHRNGRGRLRSRRPPRSVSLLLHLFSERGPVSLSGPLSRCAERSAQFSVP